MRLLIVLFICIAAGRVGAEEDLSRQETCTRLSAIAEAVMTKRQDGAAMSELMGVADGEEVLSAIIVKAYKENRYSTAAMKKRVVDDFRDEYFLYCWNLYE